MVVEVAKEVKWFQELSGSDQLIAIGVVIVVIGIATMYVVNWLKNRKN